MDKKYIAKNLALPKEVLEALEEIRKELTEKLGFQPSLSETVAYLCNFRKQHGNCTGDW